MKSIKNLLAFAILAISIAGVSAVSAATMETKPERTVEQRIAGKLRGLPRYGVFDYIDYQVNGSTVVLSGKVITLGTKRDAATAVKDISGVTSVVNNIEELPIGSFDNDIRRAVYASFVSRGPGQYFSTIDPDVHIIVENGRLTLEGYVARKGDSDLLNILANSVSGVFSVQNNLVVGRSDRRS